MEESPAYERRESAAPLPPRWKGIDSINLVEEINRRCVGFFCEAASKPRAVLPPAIAENREEWTRLSDEAREGLVRQPFVLVDVQFMNAAWWRRASAIDAIPDEGEEGDNGLPREPSEHLMQEITMFAWQSARWHRTAAQMALGMSSSTIDFIATLTPLQVRTISTHRPHAIRLRWDDDPQYWRDLLVAANNADQQRLATLDLHGKLRICSELANIRE